MKRYHPALIILDVKLPQQNGWEVLAVLKEDRALQNILVVLLTSGPPVLDSVPEGNP